MEPVYMMAQSPLRLPSWRYQRAVHLVEQGRRIRPKIDDAWVARIKTFVAANGTLPVDRNKSRRCKRDQDLADASALYNGPTSDRALVEALLLTNATFDVIANRCHLSVEAITAFEAVFYDVRQHFASRDWVASRAIGSTTPEGLRAEFPYRLWRLLAFHGGQDVLETLIAVLSGKPLVPPPGLSFTAAIAWQRETELRCRLHVTALMAETPEELKAVARIGNSIPRVGAKCAPARKQPDTVLKIMEDFLAGFERTGTRRRRKSQKLNQVAKGQPAAPLSSPIALAFQALIK